MPHRLQTVFSTAQIKLARIALLVTIILILTFASTFAQNSREQVEDMENFGRVTELYFRGGQVKPEGIERFAAGRR